MRLVEHLRTHPWRSIVAAGALVGCVVGLFLPIRAASPPKADAAEWSLPPPAALKRFDEARYQSVRSARFWGEIKAPGQRGAQAATWNLGGIVTRPVLRIAVTIPGKPGISWIRQGGAMPDGSTFVAANRDTVWHEKGDCRRARKLYQKPTAESDACIGAPARPVDAPSSAKPASAPAAPSPAAPRRAAPTDSVKKRHPNE